MAPIPKVWPFQPSQLTPNTPKSLSQSILHTVAPVSGSRRYSVPVTREVTSRASSCPSVSATYTSGSPRMPFRRFFLTQSLSPVAPS